MRTRIKSPLLYLILSLTLPLCSLSAEVQKLSVQIKETKLRAKPESLAPIVASLRNNDQVDKLADPEKGWVKVRTKSGAQGFVHASALTASRLRLTSAAGSAGTNASASDVQNAAKGFDKETERQLARQDSALNYSAVNEMEKLRVSQGQIVDFLKAGELGGKL